MTASTVSIDRTSLSLDPLVISGAPGGTYMLTEAGLGRPAITARTTAMPDSPDIHGSEFVAVVKEQSSLPLEVLVQADTTATLEAAISALDAALWQFSYSVTVTSDGVATKWRCSPAAWGASSGLVEDSMVKAHYDVLTITIPVYPIPVTP